MMRDMKQSPRMFDTRVGNLSSVLLILQSPNLTNSSFSECIIDEDKPVCSYDKGKDELTLVYNVKLTPPVWTFKERDALVNKEAGKIYFWGCSENYSNRWV
jgi:hypothetical protein